MRFPSRPRVLRLQLPPSTVGQSLGGRSSQRQRRGRGRGTRAPSCRAEAPPLHEVRALGSGPGTASGRFPQQAQRTRAGPERCLWGRRASPPVPSWLERQAPWRKGIQGCSAPGSVPRALLLYTKAEFIGRRVCLCRTFLHWLHSYLNCVIYMDKNGGPRASQVGQRSRICLQSKSHRRRGFNPWDRKILWKKETGRYSPLGQKRVGWDGRPEHAHRQDTHRSGNNRGSLPP